MEHIPISALESAAALPATRRATQSIRGVITLLWPFSSSQRRAALLLAEPDFRLRSAKGQVRVQLQGAAAAALARAGAAIGDDVVLGLGRARFVEKEELGGVVGTPGRSVDVELLFRDWIVAEVRRGEGIVAKIDVDEPSSTRPARFETPVASPSRESFEDETTAFETPLPVHRPAFHKRSRMAEGALVDAMYDPFTNDDDFDDMSQGRRKRARTSWGSSARWKLVDRIPSPDREVSLEDALETPRPDANDPMADSGSDVVDRPSIQNKYLDQALPQEVVTSSAVDSAPDGDRSTLAQEAAYLEAPSQPVDEFLPMPTAIDAAIQSLPAVDSAIIAQEIPQVPAMDTTFHETSSLLASSIPPELAPLGSSITVVQESESLLPAPLEEPEERSTVSRPHTPKFEIVPDAAFQFSFISPGRFIAPEANAPSTSQLPTDVTMQTAESNALDLNNMSSGYIHFDQLFRGHAEPGVGGASRDDNAPDGLMQSSEKVAGIDQEISEDEDVTKIPSDDFGPFSSEPEDGADENPPTNELVDLVTISDESEYEPEAASSHAEGPLEGELISGDNKASPFQAVLPSPSLGKHEAQFAAEDKPTLEPAEAGEPAENGVTPMTVDDAPITQSIAEKTGVSLLDDSNAVVSAASRLQQEEVAIIDRVQDDTPWPPAIVPGFSGSGNSSYGQSITESEKQAVGSEAVRGPTSSLVQETSFQTTVVGQESQLSHTISTSLERAGHIGESAVNDFQPSQASDGLHTEAVVSTLSRETTFASLASQSLFVPENETEEPDTQQERSTQNGTNSLAAPPASPPAGGLRTRNTYYTPLSHILAQVNRQKAHGFDDTSIDILAVATTAPAKPKRAKDGAKNMFTTFRVTQPGLHPQTVGVTLFRAKGNSLPKASKGEVVLLKGLHSVTLNKGGVGLQSGEDAAWCVWRPDGAKGRRGRWVEEVKGPAVEVGDEERAEVVKLRDWFRSSGR